MGVATPQGALQAIRAFHLRRLKEKAHIAVEQGCRVIGVMDELGVLAYGQV